MSEKSLSEMTSDEYSEWRTVCYYCREKINYAKGEWLHNKLGSCDDPSMTPLNLSPTICEICNLIIYPEESKNQARAINPCKC